METIAHSRQAVKADMEEQSLSALANCHIGKPAHSSFFSAQQC